MEDKDECDPNSSLGCYGRGSRGTCLVERGILWMAIGCFHCHSHSLAAFVVAVVAPSLVRPSLSQLPPRRRPPACQLGALTSSPSSSRRRSICLLGWQVSMQLFAALHIGRTVFPKLDPPTMPGTREREATDTGEERGSEAVGPVRPAAVR